jgi:dephospho-CoA kinase
MKTRIIGLTGGIGSGKTTIANYFESQGVPVYIADEEAKKLLYQPDTVEEVRQAFGDEVITDGLPDRKKLAGAVFTDPEKLKQLNAIIHPKVDAHFRQWVQEHSGYGFVIKEAAILFESGSYKHCDKVILVTAPMDLRLQRVIKRDAVTADEVKKRIVTQWDDEKKKELSDYVIENVDIEAAKAQAAQVLKELKLYNK